MRVIHPYVTYEKTSTRKSSRKRNHSTHRNTHKKSNHKKKRSSIHRNDLNQIKKKPKRQSKGLHLIQKFPELRLHDIPDLNKMILL